MLAVLMWKSVLQLMAIVVLATDCMLSSEAKCLTDTPDGLPRRHFYYNSSSLPIKIQTSDRSSHQLVSRILSILLEEVLGYDKVELKHGYNTLNADAALEKLSKKKQGTRNND